MSPTGELAVIYFNEDPTPESGTDWNVYCRFSGDGGATWGPEVVVRDFGDLQRHSLGVYDARGNYYAGWEGRDTQNSEFNLYCRARIGCVWMEPEIIQTDCGITDKAFRVHNNVLWCTFSHKFGGPVHNVYLRYKNLPEDWTGPGPVTGLSAVGGENRVSLSWTNPTDADFLATVVRAGTTDYPGGPFEGREVCVRVAAPGTQDSYVDYRLSAPATYYYSVFAQDFSGNWSPVSHAAAVTTADVTPPANPSGFVAEPYTSRDIKLSWTNPPDIDLKGTIVRCKTTGYPTSPNDGTLVCNRPGAPGSSDFFIHTGLAPGVTYYYRAFAYDSEANPNYSTGVNASAVPIEMSIHYAKGIPDNSPVLLYGKAISANFVS
ncbi:MAG: fibronectin type III domain-containing protein, partial [Armatimonadota bacterium]